MNIFLTAWLLSWQLIGGVPISIDHIFDGIAERWRARDNAAVVTELGETETCFTALNA